MKRERSLPFFIRYAIGSFDFYIFWIASYRVISCHLLPCYLLSPPIMLICQAAERTIHNLVALEHTVLHLVALWVGSVCSAAWIIFRCAHKSTLQLPGTSFLVLASIEYHQVVDISNPFHKLCFRISNPLMVWVEG